MINKKFLCRINYLCHKTKKGKEIMDKNIIKIWMNISIKIIKNKIFFLGINFLPWKRPSKPWPRRDRDLQGST